MSDARCGACTRRIHPNRTHALKGRVLCRRCIYMACQHLFRIDVRGRCAA